MEDNYIWYYTNAKIKGKKDDVSIYVWAKDPIEAFEKCKNIRKVNKKGINAVVPLRRSSYDELELSIINSGMNLDQAKQKFYIRFRDYPF